jgi:hypothetical protein
MTPGRSIQILTTGLKAAHERMFRGNASQRPEYPRNFLRLYGWAEDHLFALLNATKDKNLAEIRACAGDVIITMSEIVEHAENMKTSSVLKNKDT